MVAIDNLRWADDLRMIYGDNVMEIFDNYVYVWTDRVDSIEKDGKILTSSGRLYIDEPISEVIPVIDINNGTIGFMLMFRGELENAYDVMDRQDIVNIQGLVLLKDGKTTVGKLESRKYSVEHPSMTLTINHKVYVGNFNKNRITYFKYNH